MNITIDINKNHIYLSEKLFKNLLPIENYSIIISKEKNGNRFFINKVLYTPGLLKIKTQKKTGLHYIKDSASALYMMIKSGCNETKKTFNVEKIYIGEKQNIETFAITL